MLLNNLVWILGTLVAVSELYANRWLEGLEICTSPDQDDAFNGFKTQNRTELQFTKFTIPYRMGRAAELDSIDAGGG